MAQRLPIDHSLFFKLVRVVNLTARPFVETLVRSEKLSLNEWRVMVVLASHPGVAAHEVAEHTGLDKMSVSRALAALTRQRRIARRDDPADARRTLLELNSSGRALFERLGALATEREAQLFAALEPAQLAQFGAVLDRLIVNLKGGSEAEQARPQRVARRST